MVAHPTTYAGVDFRSRLEARWAAFFDLMGWRWEYEPIDEAGWVPDFLLIGRAYDPIPVEVKPIEWPALVSDCMKLVETLPELEKVRKSGRDEALILGAYLPLYDRSYSQPALGIIWDGPGWRGADPALLYRGRGCVFDFMPPGGSWSFRQGYQDLEPHLKNKHRNPASGTRLRESWDEAGNVTRWRGARR